MKWPRASSGGLPWVLGWFAVALASPSAAATSEFIPLGTKLGTYGPPSVAMGAQGGGLITAYVVRPSTGADIYAWPLEPPAAGSKWPEDGLAVCALASDQANPTAASDGRGGFAVAWEDLRGGSEPRVYVQHVLGSGVVDRTWAQGGVAVCGASGAEKNARIVPDGEGGVLVAWEDLRDREAGIYLQRISPTGRVSSDWPADGLRISAETGEQGSAVLLPDGSGGAVVSWAQLREGSEWAILTQHVLGTGRIDSRWPASGSLVCKGLDGTSSQTAVSDGAGGVVVAWSDRRHEGISNVYVQRILESGEADPRWPDGGAPVDREPTGQRYPALVGDGASGVFVAWQDARLEGNESIFVQHLTDAGEVAQAWPTGGVRLSGEKGQHVSPRIASLGHALIVAWLDRSVPGEAQPRVREISADGQIDPRWPEGGAAFASDAAGDIIVAATKPDNGVCVWNNSRSGELQGIRLTADPPEITKSPVVPAVTTLMSPRPNPARSEIALRFSLARRARARLSVFDVQGRRLVTLIDGILEAGPHEATWNTPDRGRPLAAPGLYFVRLEVEGRRFTERFATIR